MNQLIAFCFYYSFLLEFSTCILNILCFFFIFLVVKQTNVQIFIVQAMNK